MNTVSSSSAPLPAPRRLPLHAFHVAHGARLESFAGYSMPLNYRLGILAEHRHTRTAAGVFDVSHMGQIRLHARSGDLREAALALESLVPVDLLSLPPQRQRYAFFTTETGGIRDDLMIANLGTCLYLVVNAACRDADAAYLETSLPTCRVEVVTDRALLAVQGPHASAALARLLPSVADLRFMDAALLALGDASCLVTRSGYTGEDGFEISLPADRAAAFLERLLEDPAVELVGLGARDSLRLEAGLCLYGHDLSEATTPVEAALEWAIQPARRGGGVRAGGFPGSEIILGQLANGATRRRVGLRAEGRPVREGCALFAEAASEAAVGRVTSGTFAPSAQCPVAMGYVPAAMAGVGSRLFADVRGQRLPVAVSDLPFVTHRYHR